MLPFSNREEEDGAASVIRTRDLTLTKGALYRWSYGSIILVFRRQRYRGKLLPFHCMLCALTSSLAET